MVNFLISGLQSLSEWFLSGVALLKCLLMSKWPVSKPTITSQELVILGNGPSLNATLTDDLPHLLCRDLMGVNLFACSEAYVRLKPAYYLWLDPAFADENHPAGQKARLALAQHTAWPLLLSVPMTFRKKACFQEVLRNPHIQVYYFNYVICEGKPFFKWFLFKRGWGMPQCQNVLISAIFQAVQLGFTSIWLTGADHTWHEDIRLNEKNELQVFDTHFYEKEKNITNEFVPAFTQTSYLKSAFLSLHKVYRGYEVVAHYAAYRGVQIRNASKKSYIDVFPKITFS